MTGPTPRKIILEEIIQHALQRRDWKQYWANSMRRHGITVEEVEGELTRRASEQASLVSESTIAQTFDQCLDVDEPPSASTGGEPDTGLFLGEWSLLLNEALADLSSDLQDLRLRVAALKEDGALSDAESVKKLVDEVLQVLDALIAQRQATGDQSEQKLSFYREVMRTTRPITPPTDPGPHPVTWRRPEDGGLKRDF